LGGFCKEPGGNFTSDPRQRLHNRHIRWTLPFAWLISQST
jgi:hypothetical protein